MPYLIVKSLASVDDLFLILISDIMSIVSWFLDEIS